MDKKCPLDRKLCNLEDCGWYDDEYGNCGIISLIEQIWELKNTIEELKSK